MNILYIAACAPFRDVCHAGGRNAYYYVTKLASEPDFKVRLVTFSNEEDAEKIKEPWYRGGTDIIKYPKGVENFIGNLKSFGSKFNPYYRYGNVMSAKLAVLMLNSLKTMAGSGYLPDVIIMDWTEISLYIDRIREIFPYAAYIGSEQDVTFQRYEREMNYEKRAVKKWYKRIQADNLKKIETNALNKCDIAVVFNSKDYKLLKNCGIRKVKCLSPYYRKSSLNHSRKNDHIIFFGDMRRKENIMAVRWFAKNVMPLIQDLPCRFIVLGNGGKNTVGDLQSDKVNVIGFCEDTDKWFAEGMCFVAPLILGAGIKIKCLEALYSGIPVMTNSVGIEGIPAVDGIDYLHCESKEDYERCIRAVYYSENAVNGKDMLEKKFLPEKSAAEYISAVKHIRRNGLRKKDYE